MAGGGGGSTAGRPTSFAPHRERNGNHEGLTERGIFDPDTETDEDGDYSDYGDGGAIADFGQLTSQRSLHLPGLVEQGIDAAQFCRAAGRDHNTGGRALKNKRSAVGHAGPVTKR